MPVQERDMAEYCVLWEFLRRRADNISDVERFRTSIFIDVKIVFYPVPV